MVTNRGVELIKAAGASSHCYREELMLSKCELMPDHQIWQTFPSVVHYGQP